MVPYTDAQKVGMRGEANGEKQTQATRNDSKYTGWASDWGMDQQQEGTCQTYNNK